MVIGEYCNNAIIKGFYNEYQFLRNDFPCKLVLEGETQNTTFNSVDELVKSYKSMFPLEYKENPTQVMLEALRLKFDNKMLGFWLKQTGGAILVNMDSDAFWGMGKDGKGANMLGLMLMRVREELKI